MRSDRIRGRGEEMKKEEKTESFESKLKRLEETAGLNITTYITTITVDDKTESSLQRRNP